MRGSIRWVATAVVGLLPAACGGSGGSPHLPDGDFVVYWADGETPGVVEAYVSDATGVHRRKVAGPTILDGDVLRVEWSPDRTRLAVLGDLETDGKSELYLVDPNADVPALEKISGVGAQAGVGSVADFEWSPDGARIAFTKAQDGIGRLDLFTVLSSGAAAIVKVSAPITATGTSVGVIDFWWRPFANVLAYKADLAIDNTFDLFVVGATGSGHQPCNIQVGMPVDDDVLTVAWAPDGSRLAFTYKESGASGGGSLFTCPPNGVGAIKLTEFFSTNRTVSDWQWAPDSTRLLYTADTFIEERIDLFVVEADGGATTTLVTMAADSDVIYPSWSPDSTRIAFGVIDALTNSSIARVVPSTGGVSVTVATAGGADDDHVDRPRWSPNGHEITYGVLLQSLPDTRQELHVVKPDGSGHRVLDSSLPEGYADAALWSPDSERLLYSYYSAPDINQRNARIADRAGGFPRLLSDVPDVTNGVASASRMAWNADGTCAVFLAGASFGGAPFHPLRLFVAGATSTFATELTAWMPDDARVGDYRLK